MNRNCIKFIYDKTTRRPRRLENNVFVLYSPEKIKLQPGEIWEYLSIWNQSICACTLLPSLSDNNIKLLNSFHISQNQLIDLPYVFALEIQNENMNRTVQLRKKQELGFFTLLNEETEEIWHIFIKTWRLNYYKIQF